MKTLAGRPIRLLAVAATAILAVSAVGAAQTNQGSFRRELKVTGPVDLTIRSGSGRIRVIAGNDGTVTVSARLRAGTSWFWGDTTDRIRKIEANPPIEQAGNTISIGKFADEYLSRNISISYDVTVPVRTTVKANTGSGSVEVGDLAGSVDAHSGSGEITVGRVGGLVVARTGSGSIEVSGGTGLEAHAGSGSIRATDIAGPLKASSGSGSVHVAQSGKGEVEVSSSSGDVVVRGLNGAARISASSGSVEVDGRPAGPWDIHSSSGGVTLRLPGDAAFDLNASAGSGSIDSSHPLTVAGRLDRHRVQGKVRGGGPLVDVRTGSGSIEIR